MKNGIHHSTKTFTHSNTNKHTSWLLWITCLDTVRFYFIGLISLRTLCRCRCYSLFVTSFQIKMRKVFSPNRYLMGFQFQDLNKFLIFRLFTNPSTQTVETTFSSHLSQCKRNANKCRILSFLIYSNRIDWHSKRKIIRIHKRKRVIYNILVTHSFERIATYSYWNNAN